MPKIQYIQKRFSASSQELIDKANDIIEEYADQGFDLTLRQLYYQFVARDLISNTLKEYGRLGRVINDARLAGLIDWDCIVDRTRNLKSLSNWEHPSEIIKEDSECFRIDKWSNQKNYVEVWIEKDALLGVIEGVCQRNDVPYFSCRGYTSQSEMWQASQRLQRVEYDDRNPVVLHMGDHDPSGIDMSRDINDRLEMFGTKLEFHRLALNIEQVEKFKPPPNPTKMTDVRAPAYVDLYGDDSWELDALSPVEMERLIEEAINSFRDEELWQENKEYEYECRRKLAVVAEGWDSITEGM